MHGLAVVTERFLREPFRIAALFGALRPRVAIGMQRDALEFETLAALLKFRVLTKPNRKGWRRGSESNRRIRLLQSPALPLGYPAVCSEAKNKAVSSPRKLYSNCKQIPGLNGGPMRISVNPGPHGVT